MQFWWKNCVIFALRGVKMVVSGRQMRDDSSFATSRYSAEPLELLSW